MFLPPDDRPGHLETRLILAGRPPSRDARARGPFPESPALAGASSRPRDICPADATPILTPEPLRQPRGCRARWFSRGCQGHAGTAFPLSTDLHTHLGAKPIL